MWTGTDKDRGKIGVNIVGSKTQNGVVSFEDGDHPEVNTASKRAYHSSSEDEQPSEPVRKKKVKKDTTSLTHKTMIRERFLNKQKLVQQEEGEASKTTSAAKVESSQKGKFYEGSSDEDDEDEEEGEQQKTLGKSAKEVMGNFKTFSSVWQDSDEEEEEKTEKQAKKKSVKPKTGLDSKTESSAPRVSQESFDITRYDPTVEDQEQFLRSVPSEEDAGQEEVKSKNNKFFEIKTDLKQAFESKKSSSGFSFGFMGATNTEEDPSTSTTGALSAIKDIYESDEDIKAPVKKRSNISTFGIQLKGKGVSKTSSSFFFSSEEDPRYEEGVSYFFDHKVDSEELRQKHTENRPVLSDILKKRFRNKQKKSGQGKHGNKKGSTFNGKKGRKFLRKS